MRRKITAARTGQRSRAAFTIVELLVVIAILAILTALILPAVQSARAAARRAQCQNNVRQLALAVEQHVGATRRYPPGQFLGPHGAGPDSTAWSWLARILPFIEEQSLVDEGRIPTNTLRQSNVAHRTVSLFLCPDDGFSRSGARTNAGNLPDFPVALTNYKGVCGSNWGADLSQNITNLPTDWRNPSAKGSFDGQDEGDGMLYRSDYKTRRDSTLVTDGLSKTLMIGEVLPEQDRWTSWPYANNAYATCAIPLNVVAVANSDYDPLWWPNMLSFRSKHFAGAHFAAADSAVHFVNDAIDLKVYRGLATIAGAERVEFAAGE